MKKVLFLALIAGLICSCNKKEFTTGDSCNNANRIVVNIHDFEEDEAGTKATFNFAKGGALWEKGDKLGILPLNLTGQEASQVKFMIDESYAGKATAVFQGTGWGMLVSGNIDYSAYYPYKENVDPSKITVNYKVDLQQASPGGTSQLNPMAYMYSKPITPTSPEGCAFDFYQFSAISKFTVNIPDDLKSKTFIAAKIIASEPVFATTATYDLTSVTSAEESKPAYEVGAKVKNINFRTLGASIPFTGKSSYVIYVINAPAELKDITLDIIMTASDGTRCMGSVVASKNQECGKIYNYTVNILSAEPLLEMNEVDLGLSVLWGDRNVGAYSVYDDGNHYAWGANAYGVGAPYWDGSAYTKYNFTDNKKVLEPEDDIATITYGNGWRMPTLNEAKELYNNCNIAELSEYTHIIALTSKTDETKKILIPLAGTGVGGWAPKTNNAYWTSSRANTTVDGIRFNFEYDTNIPGNTSAARGSLYVIRPVKDIPSAGQRASCCSNETIGLSELKW